MQTTIDKAGRVVIPKAMRDELGLAGGSEVDITLVDGRLQIEPVPVRMWLERSAEGYLVARTDRPMPPLTQELVRERLERIRR